MTKNLIRTFTATFLALPLLSEAAVIQYEQLSQEGSRYEYSYQVTNDNIDNGIEEFSIYFDYNLYDNLEVTGSPTGWDPLALQSDLALLEDGLVDWLTFTDPLAIGNTLIDFNVAFDFIGDDVTQLLQIQTFDVFDSNFDVIDTGFTSEFIDMSNVPEPSTFVLFSLCLAACGRFIKVTK